jgi:hypothetical protein
MHCDSSSSRSQIPTWRFPLHIFSNYMEVLVQRDTDSHRRPNTGLLTYIYYCWHGDSSEEESDKKSLELQVSTMNLSCTDLSRGLLGLLLFVFLDRVPVALTHCLLNTRLLVDSQHGILSSHSMEHGLDDLNLLQYLRVSPMLLLVGLHNSGHVSLSKCCHAN